MARVNTVDFDKARKKRQRAQNTKRILILLALAGGIGLLIVLNNFLVEEGVTTRISDLIGSYGGSGYPVPLPGGVIRDVKNVGDNLAVLNDTNLYIYSPKGKQISSVQRMGANTVLITSSNRLMTYDPGSDRYVIYSRSKVLHEKKDLEFGVFTADMNAQGDYVVVTGSKQRACEVRAYNRKYEEIYICYFTELQISAVGISPKGSSMAAGYIGAKDGQLLSGVKLYRFSREEEVASLTFPDELLLDVSYYEEDRIGILTDKYYRIADSLGGLQAEYSLGDYAIGGFEQYGRQVLLMCEDTESGLKKVILLDEAGEVTASWVTEDKVLDLALGPRNAYVLTDAGIYTFDSALAHLETDPMLFVTDIHLVGDRLYYMAQDEIRVLGQEDEKEKFTLDDSSAEDASYPVSLELDGEDAP